MHDFETWSHDITQAYLQSDTPLQRNVYRKPPPERSLSEIIVLRTCEPFYGIADSAEYWGLRSARLYESDLGVTNTCSETSLYYRRSLRKLMGRVGILVDDTLQCGSKEFWTWSPERSKISSVKRASLKKEFLSRSLFVRPVTGVF